MDIPSVSTAIPLATVAAASGLVYTWAKILKIAKKDRAEHEAKILQSAKEADSRLRTELESKINALDTKIKTVEISLNKDMDHIRETYSAEIKVLGEKIEQLRDELRNQHSQMVGLLSKLIDSKD